MNVSPGWVYILFTALTALAVLMQAAVLLGMLLAMKKALAKVTEAQALAEKHVVPLLGTTRQLLEDVSPKLKLAAQNVLEASHTLRHQSTQLSGTVDDLLKKTESQAAHVDEMVTATLNSVAHATATVQRALAVPVRQFGALFNGLRAGFDVLRAREHEVHAAADGDHFV